VGENQAGRPGYGFVAFVANNQGFGAALVANRNRYRKLAKGLFRGILLFEAEKRLL
jgi:hypothetical protein